MTTTPTTNYSFLKITSGTEKDVWATPYNNTLDLIDARIKDRQNENAAKMDKAGGTFTGKVTLPAGTAPAASINIPAGIAPSAPVAGDFWSTSAAFFVRVGTTTYQLATTADVTTGLAGKANTSHTHAQSDITNLTSDLAAKASVASVNLKADLASPPLTGTPTAPTAAPGTNTTQLATTAFVTAAVTAGGGGGLPAATDAEIWAATSNAKAVTPANAATSGNEVAVTYAASLTINFGAGINFAVGTLTGNITTFAASGITAAMVGRSGYIKFTQDGTGGRTLNNSAAPWKGINQEDIILSTGANMVDYVFYTILSTTAVLLTLGRNIG